MFGSILGLWVSQPIGPDALGSEGGVGERLTLLVMDFRLDQSLVGHSLNDTDS